MFKNVSKMIYLKTETKTSQKGNEFKLVHVADPVTYEKLEFFADKNLTVSCQENAPCTIELFAHKMGYATSMNCVSVSAMKV